MDISLVIPVDGRYEYLARALTTILRQRALRSSVSAEIIVVDNARDEASRTATRQACLDALKEHPRATVSFRYVTAFHANLRHCNGGFARNIGIRLAQAPIIFMSDADILHVTETVAQHVERHRQIESLLLYSYCRDCDPTVCLSPTELDRAVTNERYALRMASSTNWYGGMCCSAPRDALLAVGGFEERFSRWGYEDYDLARRLQLGGARVIRDDVIHALHQTHQVKLRWATVMKTYAALRLLRRVAIANSGRKWGSITGDVDSLRGD